MKKQTSKERKRDERKSKSAARPTRHARIMRGVVTPILGLLAVACIGLGIMNATYWKPSSQIAASAAVKGTQYIVTDPGVLPLVDNQVTVSADAGSSDRGSMPCSGVEQRCDRLARGSHMCASPA